MACARLWLSLSNMQPIKRRKKAEFLQGRNWIGSICEVKLRATKR
jgi:hypothetical protein